jgi:hypothetical protein
MLGGGWGETLIFVNHAAPSIGYMLGVEDTPRQVCILGGLVERYNIVVLKAKSVGNIIECKPDAI